MEDLIKNRNYAVDIIRITAFCLVVTVHFFLNTEYYNIPINNINMFLLTLIRNFAMSCVPLFLIITGYLMSKKKLSREYYKGITRTLIIFIIAEIICTAYDKIVFSDKPFFKSLLTIGTNHYSWYIDLYIGLFLIIPFLNLIYNGLQSKKQKQLLVVSMVVITNLFPTLTAIFSLPQGWWRDAYPLTYYFLGCYIREFSPKSKSGKYIALIVVPTAFSTILSVLIHPNHILVRGEDTEYTSFFVLVTASALFCALLKLERYIKPEIVKTFLSRVSRLILGAYLISYITDDIIYEILINSAKDGNITNIKYLVIAVPISIVTALCLSYFINLICDVILYAANKIKKKSA